MVLEFSAKPSLGCQRFKNHWLLTRAVCTHFNQGDKPLMCSGLTTENYTWQTGKSSLAFPQFQIYNEPFPINHVLRHCHDHQCGPVVDQQVSLPETLWHHPPQHMSGVYRLKAIKNINNSYHYHQVNKLDTFDVNASKNWIRFVVFCSYSL